MVEISTVTMDYECNICQDTLIDPVTLPCGHSFCQLCLSKWVLQSSKRVCAMCKAEWEVLPKPSFVLREAIDKANSHNSVYLKRKEAAESEKSTVQTCQDLVNSMMTSKPNATVTAALGHTSKYWIGIALVVTLVAYFWPEARHDLLDTPLPRWSEADVQDWLSTVGSWTRENLSTVFDSQNINGYHMASMNKDDVYDLAKAASLPDQQFRQLLTAVETVQHFQVKPPQDYWEYKKQHPGHLLWLQFALKVWPRASLLYVCLYEYEEVCLPLIHVCDDQIGIDNYNLYTDKLPSPTVYQWIKFIVYAVLSPHFGIFLTFALRRLWYSNIFLAVFASWYFFLETIIDVMNVFKLISVSRQTLVHSAGQTLKSCVSAFFVYWLCSVSVYHITPVWAMTVIIITDLLFTIINLCNKTKQIFNGLF